MKPNIIRIRIKNCLNEPLNYGEIKRILNISNGLLNYHLRILKQNNKLISHEKIKNNRKIVIYEKC
jgi:predicted transcriptional regulator